MGQDILVVAEHLKGEIADVTYELLGKGRELATATGGTLLVACFGVESGGVGTLGTADTVISVEHANLSDFNPETWSAALTEVIEQKAPRVTLVPYTSMGMDLAASVALKQNLPYVSYGTDVTIEDGTVVATSQLYGGKIYSESVLEGDSVVVSVLAGAFPAEAGRKEGSPQVEEIPPPASIESCRIRFKELIEPEAGDVDITQHEVLVSVGRGIQSEDNLPLVEELALALGGVVCSSRPIVDNKWLPKSRQVGKSGLKVKPRIYLALGISGAPEHIEGMKDAELIIAVNTDATAPIFEFAHYGATEDILDVIPALTARLR